MNRRNFSKKLGAAATIITIQPFSACNTKANIMDRIAMSTVNFRERFDQTRSENNSNKEGALTLTDIPKFFADRFQLQNVEFWSKHFESIEPSYLMKLNKALKDNNSKLINIQFDEAYELGAENETIRKESLELALKWVDVAKTLNSACIRVNPGSGNMNYAIEALKIINESTKQKGIILMVENHFGMEMDPDVHLKIIKDVGENTYTLPDFGNYSDENRYESLTKIMPYAYQVSAKTIEFDKNTNHLSFDFDRCMKIAIENGFNGIYSVEQWSPSPVVGNEEAMADWMIEKVKNYCK